MAVTARGFRQIQIVVMDDPSERNTQWTHEGLDFPLSSTEFAPGITRLSRRPWCTGLGPKDSSGGPGVVKPNLMKTTHTARPTSKELQLSVKHISD